MVFVLLFAHVYVCVDLCVRPSIEIFACICLFMSIYVSVFLQEIWKEHKSIVIFRYFVSACTARTSSFSGQWPLVPISRDEDQERPVVPTINLCENNDEEPSDKNLSSFLILDLADEVSSEVSSALLLTSSFEIEM